MTFQDIIKTLGNKWVASIASLGALLIFYNVYPNTWQFIFSILLAYLIADLVKTFLITGGNGIIQFPFTGSTQTQHEGHGYLIFLIYIVLGTIVSVKAGDYITQNILSTSSGWQKVVIPNATLIGLLYTDFYLTFKSR